MGSLGGAEVSIGFDKSVMRAAVLGIGTATPPNPKEMSSYAEYYFRVTNSEHMVDLKKKFSRICERTTIQRKHSVLTEEMLAANPCITAPGGPSLDAREDILAGEVPRLAMDASLKAIADWGGSLSDISHIIFTNTCSSSMPGADYELAKLLGLPLSIKRFMFNQLGCYAGGTVLRLSKDIAENDRGARILVVCSEIMSHLFRGPSEGDINNLVVQSLFGDGAAALIVGADPREGVERALFEIVSASQNVLPESEGVIVMKVREMGIIGSLRPEVPTLISNNIENLVMEVLKPLGLENANNNMFWMVHPGGPAILDVVEKRLALGDGKLSASREVLREYGNMSSPTVLFVMEQMRRSSEKRGMATAGEGLEWGVLFGFGPGITVETVVLRCP